MLWVWMPLPTEPEQYMLLLADMMLMDLPLEALSILQDDSLCSVSRDFSLQLLHSRLRDQPAKGTGCIKTYLQICSLFLLIWYNKEMTNFDYNFPKIIYLSTSVFFNGVMRHPQN